MKSIQTDKAPAAIGPYSQAVFSDPFLYTSGQLGILPASGQLQPDIASQTMQSLENLSAVLEAAGLDRKHVLKTTIFLKSMADFDVVNKIYADFFGDHKPARSTVEVSKLPKNALVEIEAVARK